MNLTRNWKKNTSCQNQLCWGHLHSSHWKKIHLRCLKNTLGGNMRITTSNKTLMVSIEGKLHPRSTEMLARASHCHTQPSVSFLSTWCDQDCWGKGHQLMSSLSMSDFSWLATTNIFWASLSCCTDRSSYYAVILPQNLAIFSRNLKKSFCLLLYSIVLPSLWLLFVFLLGKCYMSPCYQSMSFG